MTTRTYQNSKDNIVDAAIRVLAEKGLKGFTTDAVIKESGLSKAGFFYNFKTKNDLLESVFEKLSTEWMSSVDGQESKDKNPVGRSLRAHLSASIEQYESKEPGKMSLYMALTELLISEPELAKKQGSELWPSPKVEKALPIEQQIVVSLAIEGLYSQIMFPTIKLTEKQKKKVFEFLIRMTEVPVKFEDKRGVK